jgi:flagellar basal body rod protein FlgB
MSDMILTKNTREMELYNEMLKLKIKKLELEKSERRHIKKDVDRASSKLFKFLSENTSYKEGNVVLMEDIKEEFIQ